MAERFEIDADALRAFLAERAGRDTTRLTLPEVIAAWSGSGDHFEAASTEVLLAELAYLIGVSPALFPRPDDFFPHTLRGIVGSYHGHGSRFFLVLSSGDGPGICVEADELTETAADPELRGPAMFEALCARLVEQANALIAPARAAAAAI